MKIVFLVLHLGYGGVERAVINQANILCDRYDVTILSTYKLYEKPPFDVDGRVAIRYLTDVVPNKDEFRTAIRSKNPAAILREGFRSLRILYLRRATMIRAIRKTDADFIVSSRIIFNKMLSDNRPKSSVIIAEEHSYHNNNEKYIRKLVNSVKDMDWFLPVSHELYEFYTQRLSGKHVRCAYIPHHVDFWPETPSDCSSHRLVTVGRLAAEKGYSDLLDIFVLIKAKVPDATLDIIGGGELETTLREKCHSLGLDKSVTLYGFQNKDFVKEKMLASSLYLLTSTEESFGIVLIEAASCGLACVAFDSARGALEVINDGETGYLVQDRDKQRYADVVSGLLCDRAKLLEMGARAREMSLEYSLDNVSRKWFDFYAACAQNKA